MQAGEVIIAPLPPPDEAQVAAFITKHRGKLRDKFLLDRDTERPIQWKGEPAVHCYSDREMNDFE